MRMIPTLDEIPQIPEDCMKCTCMQADIVCSAVVNVHRMHGNSPCFVLGNDRGLSLNTHDFSC